MNRVPPHAQIDWDDQGRPRSRAFDDVYFSDGSGLEETRYVFIEQNRLKERFQALPPGGRLVIGETGFGTGLNFLCAWQLFDQHAPAGTRLHFVSVEKYPLSHADLQRALALWPELAPFAAALLKQYVAIHAGFQRLLLDNGRVSLTLLIGDALEQLPLLDARIDAWFLDGFAPAKNPEMWTPELFAELARLAAPGSTLSTFTSTGWVRRSLNARLAGNAAGAPRCPGPGGLGQPPGRALSQTVGPRHRLVAADSQRLRSYQAPARTLAQGPRLGRLRCTATGLR